MAEKKVRRSEAIREVGEGGQGEASLLPDFRTFALHCIPGPEGAG
jgi:hypothetical protein